MARHLQLAIENAGDTTCAALPGIFCSKLRVSRYGTAWVCSLFDKALIQTTGWLQRLPECIEAERRGEKA